MFPFNLFTQCHPEQKIDSIRHQIIWTWLFTGFHGIQGSHLNCILWDNCEPCGLCFLCHPHAPLKGSQNSNQDKLFFKISEEWWTLKYLFIVRLAWENAKAIGSFMLWHDLAPSGHRLVRSAMSSNSAVIWWEGISHNQHRARHLQLTEAQQKGAGWIWMTKGQERCPRPYHLLYWVN